MRSLAVNSKYWVVMKPTFDMINKIKYGEAKNHVNHVKKRI